MNAPINWLLAGEPWIAYRTRQDLLGEAEPSQAIREKHLDDPNLKNLVTELANWPGQVISSHKSAGQPFHKLTFVADVGFKADDAAIRPIIARILEHQSGEGPFQLPTNVPVHFGGSGADTLNGQGGIDTLSYADRQTSGAGERRGRVSRAP